MLLITGAGGSLGGLVAESLRGREDVVVASRRPETLPVGFATRRVDFDDPAGLVDAFDGAATLLLISAGYGEDDVVIARHGAAIDAAEKAGVEHIVYTSLTGAGDHLPYALAHRWTERRLAEGATAWTVLRNGLYAELLAGIAAPDAEGRITAPLGEGKLAAVARRDLAEIAARVSTAPAGHAGRRYELAGREAIGGDELARAFTAAGYPATYRPGTLAESRKALLASGAPHFQVPMLLGTFSAIAGGFLAGSGGDLLPLLGREPTAAAEAIA